MIKIQKAERIKTKLRLGLAGPAGSGKTMSALKLGKGLVGDEGKKILIDTENGSGNLYADLFNYDIITIAGNYAPKYYTEAIEASEKAGYDVIIIDSLTHAWTGIGGLLEQVSQSRAGSSYAAWRDATPQHNRLVDAMLTSPKHIIATIRSKTAYNMEDYLDAKGQKKVRPVKIGLAPVQREGMDYEFTIMMDIDQKHYASATKDRTNIFKDEIFQISEETGLRLKEWLNTGKNPPEPEKPQEEAKTGEKTALAMAELKKYLVKQGITTQSQALAFIKGQTGKEFKKLSEITDPEEIHALLLAIRGKVIGIKK